MTKMQVRTLSQGICNYRPFLDLMSSPMPSGKLFPLHEQCGDSLRGLADSQSPKDGL